MRQVVLFLRCCGKASSQPLKPLPPQGNRNRLTFALLETITRPTLLIIGGAALYASPPVQRLLADRISYAETLIIAEVRHAAYGEQPDIFNRAVLAFIQRVNCQARSEA